MCPQEADDVPQSIRIVIQFYDPARQNYKYRKGYSVSAKLPSMRECEAVLAEVRRLVKKAEAQSVVDRARSDLARYSGDPSVDAGGE